MSRIEISRAVEILRRGGLVAFPTETVYGLGADATNAAAVRRIFQAKGRPSTNPLICHVADARVAQRYAKVWPEAAQKLAERFWPGPLTIVLPKARSIVDEATAGLPSVGLRAPDHPLALQLLREFDGPIAGPSANRSSHISPTTAQHVRDELGASVDLILDGGPCRVGIESTVLDLSGNAPRVLRPGAITRRQIEPIIGPIEMMIHVASGDAPQLSPGQLGKHYAPRKPAYRFERNQRDQVLQRFESDASAEYALLLIDTGVRGMQFSADEGRNGPGWKFMLPPDPILYAQKLYAALRLMDDSDATSLYIEMPPEEPQWTAVRDRLTRATQPLPAS